MCKCRYKCMILCGLWLGFVLPGLAAATDVQPGKNWQERRLFQPTTQQLQQERQGQVFIYDGLEQDTVQKAMDANFDRIQNMMFTRIHHLPPTGSGPAIVENDGCGD